MTSRIGILGAGGRMGRAIIEAVRASDGVTIGGAAERPGHPCLGESLGGTMTICGNPSAVAHNSDVLVDFTTPDALKSNLDAALGAKCALVIGTTGLTGAHLETIDQASRDIAVLQTANTSLGVNMLAALVMKAAAALDTDWDIEVVEMHHRHKVDAPSGTALLLAEAAAKGRGSPLASLAERGRDGPDSQRRTGAIGMASLRGGSVAGDHDVIFAAEGERMVLSHKAESRETFARGAVRAARWLTGKPAGLYTMKDVLGL
ncbi:4-hydroxy-tetrahydrodipicolinate reductase [Pacificimonas sp. WHA3]|uniref:4-hydroxy-tetrahydrodipicolinate reductase n=1 Tax=Pacificimonas pallii TaxID=2827236 RepID=A0ABS6SC91_9SPHN|nr:4-hydroxy-tetrahydrodipicolinate reductase [Pacificimonas pallii]MBV7256042.1 4-hydroxy-tetrahydrodipicolinate reductase [Pacificimonas pallii]